MTILSFALLPSAIQTVAGAALAVGQALPAGPPGPAGQPGLNGANLNPAYGLTVISTSTYTVLNTDTSSVLRFILGTTCVVTLPVFLSGTGYWYIFDNDMSGQVIINPASTVIDGVASMTVDAGCTALIFFNGGSFESIGPTDGGWF